MQIFKKYIFAFVLFLWLLFRLILVPYPEGAPVTQFDKCCGISEVSKLCICTCICTCNPTLNHFCAYYKCISVPSHQKDQKCLRSTSNLKFSWSVSWRHFFQEKNRGTYDPWHFSEGPSRIACKTASIIEHVSS